MMPPLFPAGEYIRDPYPTRQQLFSQIAEIAALPTHVRSLVTGLHPVQLDTQYRNWTLRQIVHHLPDSHINAFVRFKLALTEDLPTIRPYNETKWSELLLNRTGELEPSLRFLESIHVQWVELLRSMTEAEFQRSYLHPQYQTVCTLSEAVGLYAHHGRHHAGQIAWLITDKKW
jgi:hypothetical protein